MEASVGTEKAQQRVFVIIDTNALVFLSGKPPPAMTILQEGARLDTMRTLHYMCRMVGAGSLGHPVTLHPPQITMSIAQESLTTRMWLHHFCTVINVMQGITSYIQHKQSVVGGADDISMRVEGHLAYHLRCNLSTVSGLAFNLPEHVSVVTVKTVPCGKPYKALPVLQYIRHNPM